MKFLRLLPILCLISGPAFAAEYTYAPKDCEFNMTFPEAPADGKACDRENPKDCHFVSTYTKIYDVSTGMRINVTCSAAEAGMMSKYSGQVMQYTLGAMAKEHIDTKDSQTAFEDLGYAKQAVLMGSKKQVDGNDSVYMSELWIGKKSVLTIEGEMTGPANEEADKLFAHIMKSVRTAASDKPATKTDEKTESKTETAAPNKAETSDKSNEKAAKP